MTVMVAGRLRGFPHALSDYASLPGIENFISTNMAPKTEVRTDIAERSEPTLNSSHVHVAESFSAFRAQIPVVEHHEHAETDLAGVSLDDLA